jgi:DNA-binding NarL/FixJ family response regulator
VAMPGLNGLETLGRINEIRPGIKVVMLSCVSDPRTVVQAIHLWGHKTICPSRSKKPIWRR